jgi:putative ABC transport system permease protein
MWRNYLIVGFRALTRNRTYAFINIFGLAVAMAACLAILLFIRYETSFDDWLPDAERTAQFQQVAVGGENDGRRGQVMPYVASTALAAQIPEIEVATSLVATDAIFRVAGRPVPLEHAYEVDGDVFDVLKLPLRHGDPAVALSQVGGIVLSESAAMRLFGRTDVVGRALTRIMADGDRDGRVTAVLRDIPANSHLRIDLLYRTDPGGPGSSLPAEAADGWWWSTGWVYARLRPGADLRAINARIPPMLRRLVPNDPQEGVPFRFELVSLRDINTLSTDWGTMNPGTPFSVIVTFGIVALFLLLVAGVNFTNLATAQATRRAREVGLRKALGANRRQLVFQFLGESILLAAIATLLGLALLEFALPALGNFLDAELSLVYFGRGGIGVPAMAFALLVGVAGGLYPAFYLSRFMPAEVLKANQSAVEPVGTGRLRSALVVGQFAVAIALIICTVVIYSQTAYARSTDPGFRPSGLLIVMEPSHVGDRLQVESFLREARAIPGVVAAARTGIYPNAGSGWAGVFRRQGATEGPRFQLGLVDGETFRTLGLRLLAGRMISETREADIGTSGFLADELVDPAIRTRGINVVIDESAARALGFADPRFAIGETLDLESEESQTPYTIVGVVNDARFGSLRSEPLPLLYMAVPAGHAALAVRFDGADGGEVRAALRRLWESRVSDDVFDASFADDRIARMYDEDEQRGIVFALFAGLAVLISCLGLFGLTAFMVERRTREIGLRKVLGARTGDIVQLLIWQFSKPVVVANLIAWPFAWWAMREWLNGFADRVDLGPTPFLLAGLLAMAIAMGTVAGHALRVARTNPIHALRYE